MVMSRLAVEGLLSEAETVSGAPKGVVSVLGVAEEMEDEVGTEEEEEDN